jgi:hypothetical protein
MHGTLRTPGAPDPHAEPPADDRMARRAGRGPQLASLRVGGVDLKVGDHVRLHPKGGADIMDLVLAGKSAVIEAIECDFEDRLHVAVAVDDDPGREFGLARMPGHRFFFSPEEIELLGDPGPAPTGEVAE